MKKKVLSLFFGLFFFVFLFTSARCSSNGNAVTRTAYASTGASATLSANSISFLEQLQNANRELAATVLPSVVTITVVETKTVQTPQFNLPFGLDQFFGFGDEGNSREYQSEALGSGFIVRKKGKTYYALSNQHVVGNASDITVVLNSGEHIPGKLVGTDSRKDIALVSFEYDEELPIIKLGDSDTVRVGDMVFAFGAPMGYQSSVTSGIISAVGRSGGPDKANINDFLQTDTAINQGNSGGPLVNIYGEVIGINNWIASSSGGSMGLGFSIPINNVKKAIEDFIDYGEVKYGWLGVQLQGTSDEVLKELGLTGKNGALVVQVFIDSPAYKGGLLPGDYVTHLNGKKVDSYTSLTRDVGDLLSGETAKFTIIRAGKEMNLNINITGRDESIVNDSSKLWPGFSAHPITDAMATQLKIKDKKGIVVGNIQTKTPAVSMGLQNYDIIRKVNDVAVSNLKDFYAQLANQSKEIYFEIERNGETFSTIRYKIKK